MEGSPSPDSDPIPPGKSSARFVGTARHGRALAGESTSLVSGERIFTGEIGKESQPARKPQVLACGPAYQSRGR